MTYDPIKVRDEALEILARRVIDAERDRDYLADEIARALKECGDTREIILEYALKTVRSKVPA